MSNVASKTLQTILGSLEKSIFDAVTRCRGAPDDATMEIMSILEDVIKNFCAIRTINGKPYTQVLFELKEEFSVVTVDQKGHFALSASMVDAKLEEVLGLIYSFVINNYRLEEVLCIAERKVYGSNKQVQFIAKSIIIDLSRIEEGC